LTHILLRRDREFKRDLNPAHMTFA